IDELIMPVQPIQDENMNQEIDELIMPVQPIQDENMNQEIDEEMGILDIINKINQIKIEYINK
ncbi:8546_t:CDS:1, partial [Paraglomus occultum]